MHADYVPGLHLEGRNIDAPFVHSKESVANKLARLCPGACKSQPVDDVIQPHFEKLKERFARNALSALGFREVAAELALEHAVNTAEFLLFPKLHAIFGQLLLNNVAAVLPWRLFALLF